MTLSTLLASLGKSIHQFKNLRKKLAKCSANIYFNKQCLHNKLTPNYFQIKDINTSPASQITTHKARTPRIEELRFLHKKKETLIRELYGSNLQVAQEWGNMLGPIHEFIIQKINTEM